MNGWLKKLSPVQVIVYGFILVILTGSVLLTLPFSSAEGNFTSFLDSLFTATSAVCITGLTVVDTYSHWSVAGKVIIFLLIQIGGLGFMTMVTTIFMALRRKITFRERTILQESLNLNQRSGLLQFAGYILKFTFTVEGIGAVLLFFEFVRHYSVKESIFYGIFHSVSAFCNAGFDILGNSSLAAYAENSYFSGVIILLIVIGGLGFTVWAELTSALFYKLKHKVTLRYVLKKLSLHTKLSVTITLILILMGIVFFFFAEYNNPLTLGELTFKGKITAAAFQSVTLRTAGFYTISQNALKFGSKFMAILLMAIGGSPAGTAGGMKTVTIGIIMLSVWAVIKGKDSVNVFGRSINMYTLQKALAVVTMVFLFIICGTMVLCFTEANSGFQFVDLLYETVSAIATVGLTTGITPSLSSVGKIVIIIGMFLGRLGPITVAIAISSKQKETENLIHYPQEDIMVG